MSRSLVVTFFALGFLLYVYSAAYAESHPDERLFPSCGPSGVNFEVHASKIETEQQPPADQSVLYVTESFRKPIFEMRDITVRVGVDGRWVGAIRMNYYVRVVLPPGEHHLCVQWQSAFKTYMQKRCICATRE